MIPIKFEYQPQPRQVRFHVTTTDANHWADEVLYGGAAGGGKSAAIVGDAFRNAIKYPGINILILRRTLPELEGSILLRMISWYPREVCKYKDQKKTWEFVNDSRINLGFCEHEKDVFRYQGKEFDIIYIDELTHFSYEQFIYLKSRNRTSNQKILSMGFRPQMKLTTNPGGVGHVWVKRRFIDIGEWEQVHDVQEVNENDEAIYVHGKPVKTRRIFIPAKLKDNSYIDQDYEAKLMSMPEALRKQLLDGDWDVLDGMFFDTFRRSIHVVEPFDIPNEWKKFCMMDEGYDPDPFVCLWGALDRKGNLYIYRELTARKLITSAQVDAVLEATPKNEKIDYTVGDTSFWNKSKATGEAPFEVFSKKGIRPFIQASKERANGWKRIREWLNIVEETDPVSGEKIETSRLKIFKSCRGLIESIPAMVYDSYRPDDIKDHPLDHHVDALRYGLMSRPAPYEFKRKLSDNSLPALLIKHLQNADRHAKKGRAIGE